MRRIVRLARNPEVRVGASSRGKNHRHPQVQKRGGGFVNIHVCPPERILRYPDGKERRIRYPCLQIEEVVEVVDAEEVEQAVQEERARDNRATDLPVTRLEKKQDLDLSSPLAFLRYVTSEEYTRRLEEENAIVRGTFDIFRTCPWVAPRKVWTVCVGGGVVDGDAVDERDVFMGPVDGDEFLENRGLNENRYAAPSVFFLRTRSSQTDVESELNKLLFRDRKKLKCSSLVDGIVVFMELEDAEAFAEGVSGGGCGGGAVAVAEHDSHDLFRNIVQSRGVAVVMRARFGEEVAEGGLEMDGFVDRLKAVLLDSENE